MTTRSLILCEIRGKITYQNDLFQMGCFAPVKHATAVKTVRIVVEESPKQEERRVSLRTSGALVQQSQGVKFGKALSSK